MQDRRHIAGFTLVELLVGLLVTSIILSAVATLAFALTSANTSCGDTAVKQTQLRHATMHVCELIRKGRLICAAPDNDLVVWAADDNGDNQINVNEVVYLERGPNSDQLRLCRFSSADNPPLSLADLALPATKAQLLSSYEETYVPLIPACRSVEFRCDVTAPLTRARLVTVSFDLIENNLTHHYEISASLRAWAGHLLNEAGDALVAADDD